MEVAVTRMRIVDKQIGVVLKMCPAVWKVEAYGLEVVDSQVLILAQSKASGGHLVAHLCLWLVKHPPVLLTHPHFPYLMAA